MISIPVRTTILLAIATAVASCGAPPRDVGHVVKAESKDVKRQKALKDLQVMRFEQDFDEDRFFASAKSGRTMILDRRTGCVYDDAQSLAPVLKSDGEADCDYGPERIVETGRKHAHDEPLPADDEETALP
jgi:hypothetical protein